MWKQSSNLFYSVMFTCHVVGPFNCLLSCYLNLHCKIPKISPRTYIFQSTFLRGLYLEGCIIGGKFVSAIFKCANDNIGALTRNW